MKRDYLAWAALLFALVATASAEYSLARAVGFNAWVAAAVPGALDVYTVRALRARKDVLAVVVAMIAVNAASHLVAAGLLPVSWPLVVAVSAIAPLVLWRVHRLADHAADAQAVTPEAAAELVVHRSEVPVDTLPEVPVSVPVALEEPRIVPPVKPLVICGDRQVWPLEVPAAADEEEVSDGQGDRLPTEAAANVIRAAWVMGTPVAETARLATRSTSYVKKVFARLEESRPAGPPKQEWPTLEWDQVAS